MTQMLTSGDLDSRFRVYWSEMNRCERAGAYWALLHVTVCLPDICAALQAPDGEAKGKRYVAWCDTFAADPLISGAEWYRMRCKVLHQGRARTDASGRYSGFAFGQPAKTGHVDHKRVDSGILHVDVGCLAVEMKGAVESWIRWLDAHPSSREAIAVEKNVQSLIRVGQSQVKPLSAAAPPFIVMKTN